MKLLDPSLPTTRRVLCTATLVLLAGTASVLAQSGSTSGSRQTGATTGSSYGQSSTSGSTTQSGTATDSSRRNRQTDMSGSTSSDASHASRDMTAARTGSGMMSSDAKLSWSDKRFVTKVADNSQDEAALAKLAAERASNPDVRNYAQRLVQDHSKVNQELMTLASAKNVEIDRDDQKDRAYRRLSDKSGQEFDREFVEHMIDQHEKDIKMFEKAASDAKDQDVRQFASQNVGSLREHLRKAQSLQQAVVPTGRDSEASGGASDMDATRSTSGATDKSYPPTGSSMSGATDTSSTGSKGTDPAKRDR